MVEEGRILFAFETILCFTEKLFQPMSYVAYSLDNCQVKDFIKTFLFPGLASNSPSVCAGGRRAYSDERTRL